MLNLISDEMQVRLAPTFAKLYPMDLAFKKRMRAMRLRAGFRSQQDAADAIGCERGTVGMWEAPSSPVTAVGSEYLLAVAAAYRVRPESINADTDDGYPFDGAVERDESHLVRLNPTTVAEAYIAMRRFADRERFSFSLDNEDDAARFVQAYNAMEAMPSQMTPAQRSEYASRLLKIMALGETGIDKRREDLQVDGSHGGDVAGTKKR